MNTTTDTVDTISPESHSEGSAGREPNVAAAGESNRELGSPEPKADPRLVSSLLSLLGIPDEATEEAFEQPSPEVWWAARSLIRRMFAVAPQEFDVVACPEGEISIDAARKHGQAIFVVCEPGGTASCWVGTPERAEERHYESLEELPDNFLEAALRELSE